MRSTVIDILNRRQLLKGDRSVRLGYEARIRSEINNHWLTKMRNNVSQKMGNMLPKKTVAIDYAFICIIVKCDRFTFLDTNNKKAPSYKEDAFLIN
jgi:hypothetical protein